MGIIRITWIDGTSRAFNLSNSEIEHIKKLNFKILSDYDIIALNNDRIIIKTAQVRCIEIL